MRVRIIAATNRDLAKDVKDGRFREDLYYRVNVLPVTLPPLRDRPGDAEQLVKHFLPKDWTVTPSAMKALSSYAWPGNVRELINVMQRATILADSNRLTTLDLPREIASCVDSEHEDTLLPNVPSSSAASNADSGPESGLGEDSGTSLDDIAKAHVLEVLQKAGGNKAKAARLLGIHRRKLYRLLERFEQS